MSIGHFVLQCFDTRLCLIKASDTYIVPQAAYNICQQTVDVQTVDQRLTYDQTAIHSPDLPFNGLHPRNPYNYMDYYSFTDPEGMEG